MIESFYENPWSMLTFAFVLGLAGGLILAAWIIQIYWMGALCTEKRSQAIWQEAALKALEEKPLEIDESRMLCAVCWEERHPGESWALTWQTPLCKEHQVAEPVLTEEEEGKEYAAIS